MSTPKMIAFLAAGCAVLAAAGTSCRAAKPRPSAAAGVVDGTVAVVRTISGGRLAEWTAEAGRDVAKGEVMGRIDGKRVENELRELEIVESELRLAEDRLRAQAPALQAKIDYLRKQAERLERLRTEKAVAAGEVERARVELLAAEAALADNQKALDAQAVQREKLANKRRNHDLIREDLVLRSPVTGLVTAVRATAGEVLVPGAPVAEVLDTSRLFIDVHVEETELAGLRIGGRARIVVDGREGETWSGRISEIGSKAEFSPSFTVAERERRTLLYKVKIEVSFAGSPFKLGMPVTVMFDR